jgi:hypothetical protein
VLTCILLAISWVLWFVAELQSKVQRLRSSAHTYLSQRWTGGEERGAWPMSISFISAMCSVGAIPGVGLGYGEVRCGAEHGHTSHLT